MSKKTFTWITLGVILLVLLAALPSLLLWGRGDIFHRGYGMMGGCCSGVPYMMGGWMGMGFGFGWLIPLLLLGFVIALGVWVGSSLNKQNQSRQKSACPNCAKSVDADWETCPYCSTALSTKD